MEGDEEVGLGRKTSGCAGLRVGVASRGKAGLRGEEWRKEAGDWASSVDEEEDEESRRRCGLRKL